MQNNTTRLPAGLLALALIPIIAILAWLWLQWGELPILVQSTLRVLIFGIPVAAAASGVYIGLTIAWRRWGWRESVFADKQIALQRATTYAAPAQIGTGEAPALPEPIEVVKPVASWMAWIDEQPHTLLGGRTKAGKTWLATALLERRIESGADVFIIDPHSSDWMGLPTAGATADERREALKAVLNEYLRRMAQREDHKRRTSHELPHDYFDPLVVLIDEANALLEEHGAEWKTVLKQVASGSRKVGISLLLLAQSPLVEDLGISGAMRENFSRIALDERSVQGLIDSERDRVRKQALQAAFREMDRPAAAQIGASTWLLDRRGLSPGHASSGATVWAGWDFQTGRSSGRNGSTPPLFGNESSTVVTSPEADTSDLPDLPTPAEIAKIAVLLTTLPPSKVVEQLDGYHPRRYAEFKQKVDMIKAMIDGGAK